MNESLLTTLEAPRFVDGDAMLVAGLNAPMTEDGAGIPEQWERFRPYMGKIPGEKGNASYGVTHQAGAAGKLDYLAGVEVSDFSRLPKELTALRVPAQRYAVFTHRENISALPATLDEIFKKWFPTSGREPADGPKFERYDERYDPKTGNGGLEIWVPVK